MTGANEVFGDTWFWIARINDNDNDHQRALALQRNIRGRAIVTSELVLGEVASHFWREQVVKIVRLLQSRRDVAVIEQTHDLFERAIIEFDRYRDKECGVVDCSSFVIMRDRGITDVLSNDRHFREVGFVEVSP